MLHVGFVAVVNDPKKMGRVRVRIPTIVPKGNEHDISGWAEVVSPPGRKPALSIGDMVLVAVVDCEPDTAVLVLGQLWPAPHGVSEAPGSGDYSSELHSRVDITEVDPAKRRIMVISVKGEETEIRVDSIRNVIEITPGPNDVILAPGGARVAVAGDPVEVMTSDGPARGYITSGSAPMTARKIT